jgi:serine protease
VAAIDFANTVASFSQKNNQVELAAPGVAVLSTVKTGMDSGFSADNIGYVTNPIEQAPGTGGAVLTGSLVNCGKGKTTDSCLATGNICLIERGDISFNEKTLNCQNKGGIAAVIWNNAPGLFSGTLNGGTGVTIASVALSREDGLILNDKVNSGSVSATLKVDTSVTPGYAFYDGTSMATPHVSGVAALVWSNHPTCTNVQIRAALDITAVHPLGVDRDTSYGHGVVKAKAAHDYLTTYGCNGAPTPAPTAAPTRAPTPAPTRAPTCTLRKKGASCSSGSQCCSGSCIKKKCT